MIGSEQSLSHSRATLTRDENARQWPNDLERSQERRGSQGKTGVNVGRGERFVSGAAGSILVVQGLARRDLVGLLIAGFGGALAYRGASGHCGIYERLGVDTAHQDGRTKRQTPRGTHVVYSILIDKSPEELYAYWRRLENLPNIMTHLKSVRVIDDRRSHWIAKAPRIIGGQVEWDAEITADETNSLIAWRALPGGDVEHRGSVQLVRALGDRGTAIRVDLDYQPPAGQLGRWVAKLLDEEPNQQVRDDLRNFKRVMEIGEVPTIIGQSRGTCGGR